MRSDGRAPDQMREISIEPGAAPFAEGSARISFGMTQVLCAASVEERVPIHRRGSGGGWVTAEYSMLPRSTLTRSPRESQTGRIGGRTHEIQRLIGRSLRSVTNLDRLGERTITLDCDVLQADGGTRTAAITGAYVALALAVDWLKQRNLVKSNVEVLREAVAAISVGIVQGDCLLDLAYEDDVMAQVDLNCVMTASGRFVEVQGTAEGEPFSREELDRLLDLAGGGIKKLAAAQEAALRRVRSA